MTKQSAGVAACLFLAFVVCENVRAQDKPALDSRGSVFQLNTDMVMFGSATASLFLGWQQNANALFQLGLDDTLDYFDLRRPGQELSRFGVLALFTGAGYIVNQAFSLTAHDERHMDTARAFGWTGVRLVRSSDTFVDMSVWEFFLGAFNFTAEPGLYTWNSSNTAPLTDQATVYAAGLNTNMLIADMIARKMDEGAGHVTDLAPYLLNKTWGINYALQKGATSDDGHYEDTLSQQGYSTVTVGNIILLHALSCALSGGFLGLMRGTWDFIVDGHSAVRPLGLTMGDVSVFWPEFTSWQNSDNISLQVSTETAWKDVLIVRAGIETPVLGNTGANPEITCGATAKISMLSLGMEFTSRFFGFPLLVANAELGLGEMFSFGIEGHYGLGATMRERREYPLGAGATGFLKMRL
jgi:hypothetical protein